MRLRRGNIPVDLTDLQKVEKDNTQLQNFGTAVIGALRELGANTDNISIPNIDDMVKIEQKPELIREVLVSHGTEINQLKNRDTTNNV